MLILCELCLYSIRNSLTQCYARVASTLQQCRLMVAWGLGEHNLESLRRLQFVSMRKPFSASILH